MAAESGFIVVWHRSDGAYRLEDSIAGQRVFKRESTALKTATTITDSMIDTRLHVGGAVVRSLSSLPTSMIQQNKDRNFWDKMTAALARVKA